MPNWAAVAEALLGARLVYFSGVTLSLYSNTGLGRFLAALELARKQGVMVAFDGNFRPRGWKGDVARARTVFTEALKRVDIALPTFEDEAMLWGDANPEATVERLQAFGIGEIVVKNGSEHRAGRRQERPRVRAGAGGGRAGRHHGGRGFVQCRLSGGAAERREPGRGRARRARPCRAGDPPSRRDHAARRGGDALDAVVMPREGGHPVNTAIAKDRQCGDYWIIRFRG